MKYANIYYFNSIQKIGGIETFFYELAKKYNDYDLTIVYKSADPDQLKRLKKYVRCIQYNGQKIECEKAFFNFNVDIIDSVEANEYCLTVHGDYKMLKSNPPQHPKINKYYGVSQTACDSFKELTGLDCELTYNPLNIEKPKRLLKLCSACRLNDPVKGGERTRILAEKLDEYCKANDCNYLWTIFTNDVSKIPSQNISYMTPRLDVSSYMADTDYIVQLSDDFEGYNYTINEGLVYGVPLVITPCKVYKELGIDDTMSIRLDFDLSNIDQVVKEMFGKVGTFSFAYKPPIDNWNNILYKSKSTYKEELKMTYKVKALEIYEKNNIIDMELGRVPKKGEMFEVDNERLDVLLGNNNFKQPFVEVIEENNPIETPKKNTKAKKNKE